MHEKQSGRNIFLRATAQLGDLYPESEAHSLVYWLMEDLLALSRVDIALGKESGEDTRNFEQAMARLQAGEPIQYILGYAWFRGSKVRVQSGVLIPRPETELAVEAALSALRRGGSVLDIGTGSGCIALAIANERRDAEVLAWDISQTALEIARDNAAKLGLLIDAQQVDIMQEWPARQVDVVVSNPPYILESEKEHMHRNVLAFEPAEALFVPDADPLLFYRQIASKAAGILPSSGHLVLEINENKARETRELLASHGYEKIQVRQDFFGKDRVVTGIRQ